MKKLMIGAAAAAMAVTSFGELCIEDTVAEGCAVYNVKFSFKTLAAKKNSNCGLTWLIDSSAGVFGVWTRTDALGRTITDETVKAGGIHDQDVFPRVRAAKRDLYWMDNATRKFEGILWQCEANCFEGQWFQWAGLQGNARINFALWEKKSATTIAMPVFRYYTKKDKSQYGWFTRDAQNDFLFLGRYGQKATKVAANWNPQLIGNQWIDAAGFGSFNGKGFVKSISGNAVGQLRPLNTAGAVCGPTRFFVQIAPMCEDFVQWCCDGCYVAVELVPASGTWSIKYNSSLSKGKKSLAKILPDYAVFGSKLYTTAAWNRIRAFVNALSAATFLEQNGYFYVAPLYAATSEKEAASEFEEHEDYAEGLEGELAFLADGTFRAVQNEYDCDVENKDYDPTAEEQWVPVEEEEE